MGIKFSSQTFPATQIFSLHNPCVKLFGSLKTKWNLSCKSLKQYLGRGKHILSFTSFFLSVYLKISDKASGIYFCLLHVCQFLIHILWWWRESHFFTIWRLYPQLFSLAFTYLPKISRVLLFAHHKLSRSVSARSFTWHHYYWWIMTYTAISYSNDVTQWKTI